jgi:GxxExxY protein
MPLHPLFEKADRISHEIIGAAMEVHRELGPGLLESVYETCLMHELKLKGLSAVNQRSVKIEYKGHAFDELLRFDILVEGCVLVESKAVENTLPVHKAQLLSYMKLMNVPVGLLINYHKPLLRDGLDRLILPGSNLP